MKQILQVPFAENDNQGMNVQIAGTWYHQQIVYVRRCNSIEGRSFTKIRNSNGLRILPWGTPEIAGSVSNRHWLRLTRWCL